MTCSRRANSWSCERSASASPRTSASSRSSASSSVRSRSVTTAPIRRPRRSTGIPSALTWIIASLHVAFGFAIIGAIVGEILGAQRGLGLVITTSQNTFNPNGVFAAMLIIAVIALTAEGLIAQLEKRLLAWRPPSPTESGLV